MGSGFQGLPASDAALLTICKMLRTTADNIVTLISDHNGQHDHPLSECPGEILLVLGDMMTAAGGALTVSGRNATAMALEMRGVRLVDSDVIDDGDDPDSPIPLYPTDT